MRGLGLALLLIAAPASAQVVTCLQPRCHGNIAGTILRLANGPTLRLGGAQASGVIDPATAYLAWDFSPTETAADATAVAGSPPVVITPTPADAAAMVYHLGFVTATAFAPADWTVTGVTCTVAGCRTPPLGVLVPQLLQGGSFTIQVNRAKYPQFHESGWSDPISFVVAGAGTPPPPPPPVNCTLSTWMPANIADAPWFPVPNTSPPKRQRQQFREVLIPASNGGTCVDGTVLSFTEIQANPITCPYVTPAGVSMPLAVGEVKTGKNAFPSLIRNDELMTMGMALYLFKISPTQVDMTATCKGALPATTQAAPRSAPAPRARSVRPKDEV